MTKREAKRWACQITGTKLVGQWLESEGMDGWPEADVLKLEAAMEELKDELERRGGDDMDPPSR